jgi:hypothetical protein
LHEHASDNVAIVVVVVVVQVCIIAIDLAKAIEAHRRRVLSRVHVVWLNVARHVAQKLKSPGRAEEKRLKEWHAAVAALLWKTRD